jgi:hypothetical protein
MAELRVESVGDGLWSWRCSTCGRRQIRTSYADAIHAGLTHQHNPAPRAPKETPMEKFAPYWKAVWAFAGTTLMTLAFACAPFSPGGDWFVVTDGEWGLVFTAIASATGFTYAAPKNKPKRRPVTQGHAPDAPHFGDRATGANGL